MKKIFLFAVVASMLMSCNNKTADNSTIQSVDLNRYLGYWYELARFDHPFERGLEYVMAHYSLREDGKIDVLNTGIKDGRAEDAKGIAKTTSVPGLLRVSFFGPFYSDYYILDLASDYSYSVVGSSSPKYLWILSRTPQLTPEAKSKILNNLQTF